MAWCIWRRLACIEHSLAHTERCQVWCVITTKASAEPHRDVASPELDGVVQVVAPGAHERPPAGHHAVAVVLDQQPVAAGRLL